MPVEMIQTSTPCLGPYSPAVKANGFAFVSGQLGMKNGALADGVKEQTKIALENMGEILKICKSDYNKVVKCNVYLKDMEDFGAVNEVYATFFSTHKPSRVCLQVARLPKDALVEIDCQAVYE